MNEICKQKECTGCMACYNICPQHCITMIYDEHGESQPKIDKEKCVNCGLCRKVCPNNSEIKYNNIEKAYASWSIDEEDRKTSTSGGIASIFYQNALNNNFKIFGMEFDENLELKCKEENNNFEIKKYKGSKYCQSFIGDNYKIIKDYLQKNEKVLFIGTPCQISGLNNYLNINKVNTENLITVDLVCHGVPSQQYLTEYIKYIEKQKNVKCNKISFRDGEKYMFTLKNDNLTVYSKIREKDLYLTAFQMSLLQRESCMNCKYAKDIRVSDITIGDFWGIKQSGKINRIEMQKGISLVLINSEKGEKFFNNCKNNIYCEERDIKEAVEGNAHLRRPSISNELRIKFREQYKKGNFVEVLKSVLKIKMKEQKRNIYVGKVKRIMKKIIHK